MSSAYMPQKGDKFNAFVFTPHKLAVGCPCVCDKSGHYVVFATDKDGNKRIFPIEKFWFEKVEK